MATLPLQIDISKRPGVLGAHHPVDIVPAAASSQGGSSLEADSNALNNVNSVDDPRTALQMHS